jgi:hypothetical protein
MYIITHLLTEYVTEGANKTWNKCAPQRYFFLKYPLILLEMSIWHFEPTTFCKQTGLSFAIYTKTLAQLFGNGHCSKLSL